MVELRKIDEHNYSECIKLEVADEQKNFVAPNVYSLAQAWVYYQSAYPFAIYADDIMVGFVMFGYYAEKNVYDIWRFMIDKRYQRKGYGAEALKLSVQYLISEFGVNEIFLSFVPNNIAAEKLYQQAGFIKTGEMDEDEMIMRLDIGKN